MTALERTERKQLLLVKGAVLRLKLSLELKQLRRNPMMVASEGLSLFGKTKQVMEIVSCLLPKNGRLQRWLQIGSATWMVWQISRRLLG